MSVYDTEIYYNGKTQTITEWANDIGLTPNGLYKRLKYSNWDYGKALTAPNVHNKKYSGKTISEWSKETGIDRHILWHRFHGLRRDNLSAVLEKPIPRERKLEYPPLIFGYHRERLYNKKKRCIHPDCFHCTYKDCRMP